MFDFFKKNSCILNKDMIKPKKDPFPDYDEVKNSIIIDIRDVEDIEYYGKYPNSVHIPYDDYFTSKIAMLDKNKEYRIMDSRGDKIKEAEETAKKLGLKAKGLKGGFFYISEVLNYKPIKE